MTADQTLQARLRPVGFNCHGCRREFFVQQVEEAYCCPMCRSEDVHELMGPFELLSGSPNALDAAEAQRLAQQLEIDGLISTCHDMQGDRARIAELEAEVARLRDVAFEALRIFEPGVSSRIPSLDEVKARLDELLKVEAESLPT